MSATVAVTFFHSLLDVHGVRVETTLAKLCARLSQPTVCARKGDAPGWSPALYEDSSRAAGKRAVSLSLLVVEYDRGITIDGAITIWGRYRGCIYTTFSHRTEAPRLRVVLALSRPITPEEHAGVLWPWAASVGCGIDDQAKDAKRFWYLPAHPVGGTFEFCQLHGEPIDVDRVLREYEPPPPPTPPAPSFQGERHVPQGNVIDRARGYLAKCPVAISGSGGHDLTFGIARALISGFALASDDALALLTEWNRDCQPPWSRAELAHKIAEAEHVPSQFQRGYLRDAPPPSRRFA